MRGERVRGRDKKKRGKEREKEMGRDNDKE